MVNALHKNATIAEGIHIIHNWDFPSLAARDSYAYSLHDVGKVCKVGTSWYVVTSTTPTFTEIGGAGGGGITPSQHAALRQLIHLADGGGPFEQFASGAYREITGGFFPTSIIWYEDVTKTQKIIEKTITRNPNLTPITVQWKAYDSDGVTLLSTVTDTITYSGVFELSRVRSIV